MFIFLLMFIIIRPFICSIVFEDLNLIYSINLSIFLTGWLILFKIPKTHPVIVAGLALFVLGLIISPLTHPFSATNWMYVGQFLNGCLLFLISQNLSKAHQEKLIFTLVATAFLIACLDLYQFFFGFQNIAEYIQTNPVNPNMAIERYIIEKRVFTPFITPNTLGGFFICLIPFAFTIKKHRWIIFFLGSALLLTQSIGAILSLFIALFFLYAVSDKMNKNFLWIVTSITAIITAIIIIRTHSSFQWTHPFFSSNMRLNYLKETWQMITINPWTGTGPGDFDLTNSRFTHNSYLQLWASSGIVAAASFIFLIISWARHTLNNIQAYPDNKYILAAFVATIAFLIHNTIDFTLLLPETGLIGAVIAGLALNRQKS